MLLSFPLQLCQLTTGGPEPIDGLLGRPLHCVAHQKGQAPDTNTDSQNRSRLLWSLISPQVRDAGMELQNIITWQGGRESPRRLL